MMLAAMLLLMPGYALSANLGYMRISLIEGDVQIKTPDSEEWGLAAINGPLDEGDQVWTPEGSRIELQMDNGTYIRLDQDSALQILSMESGSSQFYLSQGRAYISYDAPQGSVLQFDTPDASTRAFNRARFKIDMSDQYTDVTVYKGYVETENSVGQTRINAGQTLSLGQDTNGEVASMGPADEWEDWNKARNHIIFANRDGGSRYLPVELRSYASDLDSSGRWVQVPDYGFCWVPTIVAGADWAPYRSGRWIWRGGDYVWVASEQWGWAPYHYGRWAFVAGIGWCWVPPAAGDVYWSPGYVGWVRTAEYVGWVPLAPGENYYGRGYYGRHSVNITNINITQVNVTNVYRNVQFHNGATIVNRKTFNTASPTVVNINRNIIQRNIFVRNNISFGTPDIKPSRGSYFVSARAVPQAKLPPQRIRNMKMRELKESRPFIKEHGRSVLNPGARTMALPVTSINKPRTPGKERPALRKVEPSERRQLRPAVGGPGMGGERPQLKPEERGKGGEPVGPGATGERRKLQPEEKEKASMPGGQAPRGERPQLKPVERGKGGEPVGPGARGEQRKLQPEEKEKASMPGGPGQKGEKPQVKPAEKGKPGKADESGKKEKKKPGEPAEDSRKDQQKQKGEEPQR